MKNIAGPILTAIFFISCPLAALAQDNILSEKIVFHNGKPVACHEKKVVVQIKIREGVYYQCFLPVELIDRPTWPQQSDDFDKLFDSEQSAINLVQKVGGQSNVIPVVTSKQ